MQKNDGPWIFCNRPQNAVSFPTPLLHSALGQFIDDATDSVPTAKDNAFVSALSYQMSGFYSNEMARSRVFIQLMWDHYRIQLEAGTVPGTDYRTNGCHRVGNYPTNISEAKPEIGSGVGDPLLQAGVYHLQFLKNIRVLASNSSLPCLNIFYFGLFLINSRSSASKYFPQMVRAFHWLRWIRYEKWTSSSWGLGPHFSTLHIIARYAYSPCHRSSLPCL
jgi:hypothetical protein